jgi:hypothetical protein
MSNKRKKRNRNKSRDMVLRMRDKFYAIAQRFFIPYLAKAHERLLRRWLTAYQAEVVSQFHDHLENTLAEHLADFMGSYERVLIDLIKEGEDAISESGKLNYTQHALPHNCRFLFRKGANSVFVIEEEPRTVTIKFKMSAFPDMETYTISLPYVVYFVCLQGNSFKSLNIFFNNMNLVDIDSAMLEAVLPNLREHGSVCISPGMKNLSNPNHAELVRDVIASFWGSVFNDDIWDGKPLSLRKWQDETHIDPQFAMNNDLWKKSRQSVFDIAADLLPDKPNKKMLEEETVEIVTSKHAYEMAQTFILRWCDNVPDLELPTEIKEQLIRDFIENREQLFKHLQRVFNI